jgi:hypothetical protein
MKQVFALVFALGLVISFSAYSQKRGATPNDLVTQPEIEAHLSFLAADEMRGRNAGSPELMIAGNYIRTFFKIHGLKTVPGADNYFQAVDQVKNLPPAKAEAQIGDQKFTFKDNLLVLEGDSTRWTGDMIYVGYGSPEQLSKFDIRGKIVLALAGAKDADNLQKVFMASRDKVASVKKAGGRGLVEILALPQAPWPALQNFLSQPQWGIKKEGLVVPHLWVKPVDIAAIQFKENETVKGSILIEGKRQLSIPGRNVVGLIEGTDTKLKDEYIIVTAHYDHIGVQKSKDNPDSIFNGARDNAIGSVALLQLAKYLSKNPPKHSVVLIALTSEEKGLLGSQWYTEHPLFPLNKTILSINCDGVGYNDKTILTSISWGRTSTDETVTKAARAYGLKVGGDPDPKEGFFERSDQVSFARKGIPAIKLQPGLASMDDEIRKYYHRQADEVSSLDFEYLAKFYRTFVYAVQLLANETKRPSWNAGDKYEETSKKLYGERLDP